MDVIRSLQASKCLFRVRSVSESATKPSEDSEDSERFEGCVGPVLDGFEYVFLLIRLNSHRKGFLRCFNVLSISSEWKTAVEIV